MVTGGEDVVARVLRAVEVVPPGCVVSYGDVAELVGAGPRQVGRILAEHGHEVAWWRVTNASGQLPSHLLAEARTMWAAEGVTATGAGCQIRRHRPDFAAWARAFETSMRE